jgi:hypothetical protein
MLAVAVEADACLPTMRADCQRADCLDWRGIRGAFANASQSS